MGKPFRNATRRHVPRPAILFDQFHVLRHLWEALDHVRKSEYARLTAPDRRFIKGQKYMSPFFNGQAGLSCGGGRLGQRFV
jgi:transposase